VEELRECALCGGLEDSALVWLAERVERIELGEGDILFREGDPARELYLVIEGEVELWKRSADADDPAQLGERINMIHAKSILGGSSVIDMQGRLATARAASHVVLLRLSCRVMSQLYREDLKSYTMVILNVARDLSRRLRNVNALAATLASHARGDAQHRD
jgi:CRP-like cAMP-binding protein